MLYDSLTGTLFATFFSSSKVFAFFAINREFSGIAEISIYGSLYLYLSH